MRVVIDMNLTPMWVTFFARRDIDAVHWSTLGDPRALDVQIMDFVREHRDVLFTHDLDFGNIVPGLEV